MNSCGHHIITDGCRVCKALQDKWYRAIEKDFNDAEDSNHPERPLKSWHNSVLTRTTELEIQITFDYYEKCSELLHAFKFKNRTIERIWELHCQGLDRKKIEAAICRCHPRYKQSQIRIIIKNLEREIEW